MLCWRFLCSRFASKSALFSVGQREANLLRASWNHAVCYRLYYHLSVIGLNLTFVKNMHAWTKNIIWIQIQRKHICINTMLHKHISLAYVYKNEKPHLSILFYVYSKICSTINNDLLIVPSKVTIFPSYNKASSTLSWADIFSNNLAFACVKSSQIAIVVTNH